MDNSNWGDPEAELLGIDLHGIAQDCGLQAIQTRFSHRRRIILARGHLPRFLFPSTPWVVVVGGLRAFLPAGLARAPQAQTRQGWSTSQLAAPTPVPSP